MGDVDAAALIQNAAVGVEDIDMASQQVSFDNILTNIINLTQVQCNIFVEQGFLMVNDLTVVDDEAMLDVSRLWAISRVQEE
jgi:hypothetical protein